MELARDGATVGPAFGGGTVEGATLGSCQHLMELQIEGATAVCPAPRTGEGD
jgi:hypothetical protein